MDEIALARIVDAIVQTVSEFDLSVVNEPVTIEALRQAFGQKLSASDRALTDMDRMNAVDDMLDRHSAAFAQALRGTGMPSSAVTLFLSWITIQLQARALHSHAVTRTLLGRVLQPQTQSGNTTGTPRTTLTITAKQQLTLTKEILRHLSIEPGAQVEVNLLPEGRVELRAASGAFSIEGFVGVLAGKTDRCASIDELTEAAARRRR